jgi:phosphoribosylglycinamide formyltransferase 1
MQNKKVKRKLGIMVSGNGSNLQAIIDAINDKIILDAEVVVIISNKENAYALERGRNNRIESIFLDPSEFESAEAYDQRIGEILRGHQVELVILAGYLRIISSVLLELYPKRILNIHPGLLPESGGVNMYGIRVHRAVIAQGAKQSGCTVHIVTEEVDKGPILDEMTVEVLPEDTPETLAERILTREHILYPETIASYLDYLDRSSNK